MRVKSLLFVLLSFKIVSTYAGDVDSLGKITNLTFKGDDIKSLPPWILSCKNLKSINLDHNPNLEWNSVVETLSKFEKLESISLRNNDLSTLPDGISKLKNITKIDVSHNKLVSVHTVLKLCEKLTNVNLDYNGLNSVHFDSLMSLTPKLKRVNLSNNELDLIPLSVCQSSIEVLYLTGNKIKDLPKCILDIPSLTYLVLSNNYYGYEKYANSIDVSAVRDEVRMRKKRVLVE